MGSSKGLPLFAGGIGAMLSVEEDCIGSELGLKWTRFVIVL